ncbi:MAG: RNA-binding transcriptional accessory protein [Paracoccaceae bacterium]|nr:RNA-binding transcriptional accessory protein [Paracoccaceae bacterium]
MTQDKQTQMARQIANEIGAAPTQVLAAVALLDAGSTVPFVARYRKEATGGLDDTQLRNLSERLGYLRELSARRGVIADSITEQGHMTDAIARALADAATKSALEDLYLPYKPKRRSRAIIARELGLGPLFDLILERRSADPDVLAKNFLTKEVPDTKTALEGARDILAEGLSENAALLGRLRSHIADHAILVSQLVLGQEVAGAKFSDYFAHSELMCKAAGHRVLAMLRGRNEGFLTLDLAIDPDAPRGQSSCEIACASPFAPLGQGLGDAWLRAAASWAWRVKVKTSLTLDAMSEMRTHADTQAIGVFARNLKDLLLAAPAGGRVTMGIDPGIRTGCKVAVIDATGKVLTTDTVYPFQPKNDIKSASQTLLQLIQTHKVALIAIGNGTASRESDALLATVLSSLPPAGPKPTKVTVSEAGASVYSASALAAAEFPDLDVSLRGAVSIARRLQDPLAELVKIEPKSIGVGQYQHDVDQSRLGKSLEAVVEDAVNAVGVDLNTASAPLLARVSGLGVGLAEAIVTHRNMLGPFKRRQEVLKVPRLGPKAYEQAAGFLRIPNGDEPLDASSVHPEAYDVARKILAVCGRDLRAVMGDSATLKTLDPERFIDSRFGLPTVRDILAELEKPGRDPRPSFKTATFTDGVTEIKDLKVGMMLEGTVTNVAAFGAFVDIGVHQDGLVHVSQLADRFVKDPHEVVKAGQVVQVRVVEVDAARKRIGLTMRQDSHGAREQAAEKATERKTSAAPKASYKPNQNQAAPKKADDPNNPFASLKGAFGKC